MVLKDNFLKTLTKNYLEIFFCTILYHFSEKYVKIPRNYLGTNYLYENTIICGTPNIAKNPKYPNICYL